MVELVAWSGGLVRHDGPVLHWGRDKDGRHGVDLLRKPTEYELTQVPEWVRREVKTNG